MRPEESGEYYVETASRARAEQSDAVQSQKYSSTHSPHFLFPFTLPDEKKKFYAKASYDCGVLLVGRPLEAGVSSSHEMRVRPDTRSRYWLDFREFHYEGDDMIVGRSHEINPNAPKAIARRLLDLARRTSDDGKDGDGDKTNGDGDEKDGDGDRKDGEEEVADGNNEKDDGETSADGNDKKDDGKKAADGNDKKDVGKTASDGNDKTENGNAKNDDDDDDDSVGSD
ncbi:hypothetical protein THAOC_26408, partial [Thalassiosira oceanica]